MFTNCYAFALHFSSFPLLIFFSFLFLMNERELYIFFCISNSFICTIYLIFFILIRSNLFNIERTTRKGKKVNLITLTKINIKIKKMEREVDDNRMPSSVRFFHWLQFLPSNIAHSTFLYVFTCSSILLITFFTSFFSPC